MKEAELGVSDMEGGYIRLSFILIFFSFQELGVHVSDLPWREGGCWACFFFSKKYAWHYLYTVILCIGQFSACQKWCDWTALTLTTQNIIFI